MENLTIVDGAVIAIILISGVLAFARGIVREVTSIAGWVGAAVIAYMLVDKVEPLMQDVPLVKDLIASSCELSTMAAFGIVFVLALIVLSLFAPLLASLVRGSALGSIDRGFGFLFGLARGILLIVVALFVYEQFFALGDGVGIITSSKTYELLGPTQQSFASEVETSTIPAWFEARFNEMNAVCRDRTAG